MSHDDELVAMLHARSVKYGTFTLASGKQSDFYVDARQTTLNGRGMQLVADGILAVLDPEVVAIGGLTLGADPVACATAALASARGRPLHAFLIRKQAKGHGTGRFVEGLANLSEGAAVAIVEDTTTTGGSLLTALERAEAAGLRVVQCLTVVDRQEGAAERIAAAGYALQALVTRADLDGAR